MIYTKKIRDAIKFATKTHEVYQKQTRKGKDIPYITHPLTVGLVLANAGADEDAIVAGILHDTIEDSVSEKKVTYEMLAERFGQNVADLVLSVTEQNKELPWEERKEKALEHIETFSHDSILVKSADVIANNFELIDDYEKDGDKIFERFNAKRDEIIINLLMVTKRLLECWPESPFIDDITDIQEKIVKMGGFKFNMLIHPAQIIEYRDYNEDIPLNCPVCGWKGTPKSGGLVNTDSHFCLDVSCPKCDKMLLVAEYSSAS